MRTELIFSQQSWGGRAWSCVGLFRLLFHNTLIILELEIRNSPSGKKVGVLLGLGKAWVWGLHSPVLFIFLGSCCFVSVSEHFLPVNHPLFVRFCYEYYCYCSLRSYLVAVSRELPIRVCDLCLLSLSPEGETGAARGLECRS